MTLLEAYEDLATILHDYCRSNPSKDTKGAFNAETNGDLTHRNDIDYDSTYSHQLSSSKFDFEIEVTYTDKYGLFAKLTNGTPESVLAAVKYYKDEI